MDYEQNENNYQPIWNEPPYSPIPPRPAKKQWSAGKAVALALCCSILSGLLTAGGVILYQKYTAPEEPAPAGENITAIFQGQRENSLLQIHQVDTGTLMTAAEVYAANVNSTVGITTAITTNFWGYQTTSAASGSGFIISSDGYILTNYHVIENSNSITVSCYDGTAYDATLVGYDASNDIAVLKVDAEGLVPVILGDSSIMNVGDSVVAIGNPLGELTFSLTAGTVSALDRQVTMSTGVTMDLIQTDCAINSGNSGGALFNMYGEVVGITNAKYSTSSSTEASIDNIGFAIPLNDILGIVESIIEKGYISKPYIGVSVKDVSAEIQSYGFPAGAAVQSITEGSPAALAGLQVSDIITSINGTSITGSNDLVSVIGDAKVGDLLNLTVFRQGTTLQMTITVGEQIQQAIQENSTGANQQYNGYFPNPWG